MSLFGVSGVHLPDTSPRDSGVLLACWEGFAIFPDFSCWWLELTMACSAVRNRSQRSWRRRLDGSSARVMAYVSHVPTSCPTGGSSRESRQNASASPWGSSVATVC